MKNSAKRLLEVEARFRMNNLRLDRPAREKEVQRGQSLAPNVGPTFFLYNHLFLQKLRTVLENKKKRRLQKVGVSKDVSL